MTASEFRDSTPQHVYIMFDVLALVAEQCGPRSHAVTLEDFHPGQYAPTVAVWCANPRDARLVASALNLTPTGSSVNSQQWDGWNGPDKAARIRILTNAAETGVAA